MKVLASYLLLVLGGNLRPTAEDIKTLLSNVGAEGDDEKIELLLSGVEGKSLEELIACGREKLASVPSGGGAAGGASFTAGGAAEEPKEEEKEADKEESDEDMPFSLFDEE